MTLQFNHNSKAFGNFFPRLQRCTVRPGGELALCSLSISDAEFAEPDRAKAERFNR